MMHKPGRTFLEYFVAPPPPHEFTERGGGGRLPRRSGRARSSGPFSGNCVTSDKVKCDFLRANACLSSSTGTRGANEIDTTGATVWRASCSACCGRHRPGRHPCRLPAAAPAVAPAAAPTAAEAQHKQALREQLEQRAADNPDDDADADADEDEAEEDAEAESGGFSRGSTPCLGLG